MVKNQTLGHSRGLWWCTVLIFGAGLLGGLVAIGIGYGLPSITPKPIVLAQSNGFHQITIKSFSVFVEGILVNNFSKKKEAFRFFEFNILDKGITKVFGCLNYEATFLEYAHCHGAGSFGDFRDGKNEIFFQFPFYHAEYARGSYVISGCFSGILKAYMRLEGFACEYFQWFAKNIIFSDGNISAHLSLRGILHGINGFFHPGNLLPSYKTADGNQEQSEKIDGVIPESNPKPLYPSPTRIPSNREFFSDAFKKAIAFFIIIIAVRLEWLACDLWVRKKRIYSIAAWLICLGLIFFGICGLRGWW